MCGYDTTARTALYNHNKSQKHLSKIQNIQNIEEKEIIEVLKTKIIHMEKELVIKDKEIERLEMKAQIYKDVSEIKNVNQSGIIKELEEKVKELQNFIIGLTGEKEFLKTNNTKKIKINKYKAKDKIPATVKNSLWRQYFNKNINGKCCCCKVENISIKNFDCGHVISEKNGGDISLENLRPICRLCNSSMSTMNMDEFIKKFGFNNQK
jgi:hypothetical protein